MKVVYVAGPYRGKHESDVVRNIRNAEAVAIRIWQAGHCALCPHKNTALFGGLADDSVWLAGDIEMLKRCDEMVLARGWENSTGTLREIEVCKSEGIPYYTSIEAWEKATIACSRPCRLHDRCMTVSHV